MKTIKFAVYCSLAVMFAMFVAACNGGGGNSGSGTVSMSVTDAKPLLPENVTNLFVEFSEVRVHKAGGDWLQLELAQTPYTLDLLQFQDGSTTQLVPPAILEAGEYTQVRIVVDSATLRWDNDSSTDQALEIPSENLKTDTNFTINLPDGAAVDLIIHFDLSMSVVATGSGKYQMKPVLHLFDDPLQAATIEGSIDNTSFSTEGKAAIIVLDSTGAVFTKAEVIMSDVDPTPFSIFWLPPNQTYTVQVDLDQNDAIDCNEFEENVLFEQGAVVFTLNQNVAIVLGTADCTP